MPATDTPEPALARWLAHGVTSATHPVLEWALRRFLSPLGIEADALEAEPFGALECGCADWWLRAPRWSAVLLDSRHPARSDFQPLLEAADHLAATVDPRGVLAFGPRPSGNLAAARAALAASDEGWNAARHSLRASQQVERFIFAAAGLLLANDPAAAVYAAGDDAAYCDLVLRRLGASPP